MKLLSSGSQKAAFLLFFSCLTISLSAQWVQIDGLPGGYVSKLSKGQNNVFATTNDGTFRSQDGGANWEKIMALPDRVALVADGPNLLASNHDNMPPFGVHLFQSADDGFNWTEFLIAQSDALSADFQILGPYVYAQKTNSSGTYRTKDFGQNWEFVSQEEFDFIAEGGTMFRSLGQVVLESSDGGFNWDTIAVLPLPVKLQIKSADEILLSSWSAQNGAAVFYSSDNGQNWKLIPVPPANTFEYDIFTLHSGKIFAFRRYSNLAIVADPLVGNFEERHFPTGVAATLGALSSNGQLIRSTISSGVILSADDGFSWHKTIGISTGAALKVQGNEVYASPESGLYRLIADKQHWELLAPEFELLEVNGFFVDGDKVTIASWFGSVWVSLDGGQSFEPGKNEDGSLVQGIYKMEAAGGQLFGWDYGTLGLAKPRYSADFGKTWKSLAPFLNGMEVQHMFVYEDQVYVYDLSSFLYRWNPTGQIFEQICNTPIPFEGTDEFSFLAPIFVEGSTYIVTEPSDSDSWNGAAAQYYVSTDAGQQWTEHSLGLSSIVSSGDTIFAAQFDFPMGYSTDHAATWQPFSEGMEGNARSLEIWQGEVFASTPLAVYRRGTNGASPSVSAFEPAAFGEYSVFPNPFSDHFSVEISDPAKLKSMRLHNAFGQTIGLQHQADLSRKIQVSSLGSLPSGIYFLEVELDGKPFTQRVLKL